MLIVESVEAAQPTGRDSGAASLLLFDGVCGLCNRLVRWLLRRDRNGVLRFAPLDSPLAVELMQRHGLPPEDTDAAVLVQGWGGTNERAHVGADAIVAALRCANVAFGWRAVAAIVPRFLRRAIYRVVARWRYRLFGVYDSCPLPPPEAQRRFVASGPRDGA